MKKLFLSIFMILSFTTLTYAKDSSYMDKIIKLYNIQAQGVIEFSYLKKKDSYLLYIKPKNPLYKEFFNPDSIMHIVVDEGPMVTKPKFTFATAGLSAKGSIFDFFNPKITKEIKGIIKSGGDYKYEGIVTFGDDLEEKTTITPIVIENDDVKANISKIITDSEFDLDTFTGEYSIDVDKITLKPKKEEGIFELNGLKLKNKITQEPIDNIMLFGKFNIDTDSIKLSAKSPKKEIYYNVSYSGKSSVVRVDRELLDAKIENRVKALDEKTVANLKAIKEANLDIEFKNLGINGVIELIKLTNKKDEIAAKLQEASIKGDDTLMQKAILEQQELVNKIVPALNKTLIANKSRFILDLKLKSDKESFVKFDFLYKGKPLEGNFQSAMISLMAQQLGLIEGEFEAKIDSALVTSINPLAIMGLDLLKTKGFATFKDGIYHIKGKVKDGKIIINGKPYTIKELSGALF